MQEPIAGMDEAVDRVVAKIHRRSSGLTRPFIVAIDGRSGAGKSTLAARVAQAAGGTIVSCDDFFAADIPNAGWESRTPEERAADVIDWRRLRAEALEPLRAGWPAQWVPFDFASGVRPDGTYGMLKEPVRHRPRRVIILDGAYSTRLELLELIDLTVLVEAPAPLRRERLASREEAHFLAQWHARWDGAEEFYFTNLRPPDLFDFVVTTAGR